MNKNISLIKACMSEGMNLFKINTKKKNSFTKVMLPIILVIIIMTSLGGYSARVVELLKEFNMEIFVLTLFASITTVITFIEGVYKSGNLLFNLKDDDLLFSLPIKKTTIFAVRIMKFYIFELLYNSLFLLPAIIVYAMYTHPSASYYLVSIVAALVFPMIPIMLSSIIGTFISAVASKFKGKNFVQTVITIIILLGIMYFSYASENLMLNLANNASSINEKITKLYYPVGTYVKLVMNFDIIELLKFVAFNLVAFIISIFIIGKMYFKVNSSVKSVKAKKISKNYVIKTLTPMKSLIKKEFNRFINSPVFVSNAGFGIVLFIVGCVLAVVKYDSLVGQVSNITSDFTLDQIKSYLPIVLFGFVCVTSLMTSITSSMISLEGKSFTILKSLPVSPYKIVKSKVLTAVLIIFPCLLLGDIIAFVKFKFDFISMILVLVASFIFPLISSLIGIIINLKYPKMDANSDTEVVKQSTSSAISVFLGMGIMSVTIFLMYMLLNMEISAILVMLGTLVVYGLICLMLLMSLRKTCDKYFENIDV